jgi:segregation and condensation protein A
VPELVELLAAFRDLMHRAELFAHHQVQREPLSVRERMSGILQKLRGGRRVVFTELFEPAEGRMGVVVSFIAILELVREALVELRQEAPFAPLEVAAAGARGDRAGPHDVIEAKVVRIEDASDE